MKGGYGSSAHDSKVEDYSVYEENFFKNRKSELNEVLTKIKSSSLTTESRFKLLDQFMLLIIKEKYNI